MAVVNRPANSITGRYQAEIFTERMWASKRRWLPCWKRSASTSSRPKACTTRTPAMPSWSCDSVLPMPSRTSRYALFESRWNLMLASTTNGTQMRHSSSSFQDTTRQHEDRDHQQDAVAHEHEQAHLHELLQRVDVAGHARHDHAGLLAVVERHRQPLQVVEHAEAQVAEERLADAADQLHLEPVRQVGDARRRPRSRPPRR